jgi:hypothetical protein
MRPEWLAARSTFHVLPTCWHLIRTGLNIACFDQIQLFSHTAATAFNCRCYRQPRFTLNAETRQWLKSSSLGIFIIIVHSMNCLVLELPTFHIKWRLKIIIHPQKKIFQSIYHFI